MLFEDLFHHSIEFPDCATLHTDGVRLRTWHDHLPGPFMNSLLFALISSETTVHAVLLMERYRPADTLTGSEVTAIQAKHRAGFHTCLRDYGDDVILVIETPDSFWVLHLDMDVSDCAMGRISTAAKGGRISTEVKSFGAEMLVASVREWAERRPVSRKIRADIPADTLRGVVSW